MAGQGQRRYEYAAANPVNGMDPSGCSASKTCSLHDPLLIVIPFTPPSWCKYVPGWIGVPDSCKAPPPPPPPCTGAACHPHPHVVKEVLDCAIVSGYWASKGNFRDRDVTYWAYDLNSNGTLGLRDYNDTISLQETTISGTSTGTCKNGACPGSPREFVDEQRVFEHAPFLLRRNWSVAGVEVPVWNLKTNTPTPFEVLHLDYSAKPPFAISY